MGKPTGVRHLYAKILAGRDPCNAPNVAVHEIALAFRKAGSIEGAAHDLGVATRTLARWIADYPTLRKAIDGARRSM